MDGFGKFVWSDGRIYTGSVHIIIKVSIKKIKSKDLVNLNGQMEDHMRDNGKMVNNMEKEFISLQVDKEKEDNGQMVKEQNG